MQCQNCGTSNPEDFTFCQECGEKLVLPGSCPQCGQVNQPGFNFCMNCGHKLISEPQGQDGGIVASDVSEEVVSTPQSPGSTEIPAATTAATSASELGQTATMPPRTRQQPVSGSIPTASYPTFQAGQVPPAPAQPQVVIIQDEEEKRRAAWLPWLLVGVLISVLACLLLVWLNVVEVPDSIMTRLPDPIAEVVRTIDEQGERQPVTGGQAAVEPEAEQPQDPQAGGEAQGKEEGADSQPEEEPVEQPVANPPQQAQAEFDPCDVELQEIDDVKLYNMVPGQNTATLQLSFTPDYLIPENTLDKIDVYIDGKKFQCRWDPQDGGWSEVACDEFPIFDYEGDWHDLRLVIPVRNCEIYDGGTQFPVSSTTEEKCGEDLSSLEFAFWYSSNNEDLNMNINNDAPYEADSYNIQLTHGPDLYATTCNVSSSNDRQLYCQIPGYTWYDGFADLVIKPIGLDCELATSQVSIPFPTVLLCPVGETYHEGWPYNNGCCTDGCWCQQDGKWGCWQTCAPHCKD